MYRPDIDKVDPPTTGAPRLMSVCFEPTNLCLARCPYCLIEHRTRERTTDHVLSVLDRLLDHGSLRIGFGGGEPLLRHDIYRLGRHVRAVGAGSLLRTSGMFRISGVDATEAFDWVDLSFDSVDPDVFRRCRPGVPQNVLMRNIQFLGRSETRVRVSILITTANRSTVEDTLRWLADAGIIEVRFQRLVRRGRARKSYRRLKPASDDEHNTMQTSLLTARSLGMSAVELNTISNTTICVVKADGRVFVGSPEGLVHRGSAFDSTTLDQVAAEIWKAQHLAYSTTTMNGN